MDVCGAEAMMLNDVQRDDLVENDDAAHGVVVVADAGNDDGHAVDGNGADVVNDGGVDAVAVAAAVDDDGPDVIAIHLLSQHYYYYYWSCCW